MTTIDRRSFLTRGAFAGAGLFTASAASTLHARGAQAGPRKGTSPYGRVSPARDKTTGRKIIALPKGFQYATFGYIGSTMSDGSPTPLALDGMAAFPHPSDRKLIRLIRNHEDRNPKGRGSNKATPEQADEVYDPQAGGGTTTLDYDPRSGRLVQDFASLKGTIVNCAGGYAYRYAGWISGEETVQTYDGIKHGYNYLVPVTRDLGDGVGGEPIVPMGRFAHEAVATDQRTGIVFQTEDAGSGVGSGFYRYIPNDPKDLFAGGKLQMLGIVGRPRADLRENQVVGDRLPVRWFDIADPDTDGQNNKTPGSVYQQGYEQGAAKFNRLEGCWWDGEDSIYFASTSGGDAKNGDVNSDGYREGYGQIWQYTASKRGDGHLELVYESDRAEALDSPDNLCVTPRGGLILCEDDASGDSDIHPTNPDIENVNRVIGFSRDGGVFEFAVNLINDAEFAGATFSPDGDTLFVNILGSTRGTVDESNEGMTIAITGPWAKGPL